MDSTINHNLDKSLLANRRFRTLISARFVSLLGSSMAPTAFAFGMLDLTHSASMLGIGMAARTIPNVLFMLIGGVIADRVRRDRVLVVTNFIACASQAFVAALFLSHVPYVQPILVVEAINGAASAFTFPASQAIMVQVVSSGHLQRANSISSMLGNATSIGGPLVGGLVIGLISPGWALVLDSATFLFAGVLIASLRLEPVRLAGSNLLVDLRDGWHEFVRRQWVWVIVLAAAVINSQVVGAFQVLGPVIADDHFGREWWGGILAAQGLGLFLGSILMLRWRPSRPLLAGLLGLVAASAELFVLGLFPDARLLLALSLIAGTGVSVFGIGWTTSLQQNVPADRLSRVSSYDGVGSFVAVPMGQILAGPVAAALGASATVSGAGAVVSLVCIICLLVPSVRRLTSTQPET